MAHCGTSVRRLKHLQGSEDTFRTTLAPSMAGVAGELRDPDKGIGGLRWSSLARVTFAINFFWFLFLFPRTI